MKKVILTLMILISVTGLVGCGSGPSAADIKSEMENGTRDEYGLNVDRDTKEEGPEDFDVEKELKDAEERVRVLNLNEDELCEEIKSKYKLIKDGTMIEPFVEGVYTIYGQNPNYKKANERAFQWFLDNFEEKK